MVFMGFFDALAELLQPLLNAIGLGPGQGDRGARIGKRIGRMGGFARRQIAGGLAVARWKNYQAGQMARMQAMQKARAQRPLRNPALRPKIFSQKRRN